MKIVFFGTPEFAVVILKKILEEGWQVVSVVSTPDRPSGRGLKIQKSAVVKFAEQQQLKILKPDNLKDTSFLSELHQLQADLFIVVAFRKLPAEVWQMPPKGTVNLHASLLPAYRGAAPINHVIINHEKITGVTTFFINNHIDCGEIIDQTEVEIDPRETAGSLHDKLATAGAELVCKTIENIEKQTINTTLQDLSGNYPLAPKISKEFCRINWNQTTVKTDSFIRGLSPYPGAWTRLDGKIVKIYEAEYILEKHHLNPGILVTDQKNYLLAATSDGFIDLKTIQIEGRKTLNIKEFLKGYLILPKQSFEE